MMNLIPFLLFAISTSLTPGPNNLLLLNSGLHFGIRKSLPHYLGICLGFYLMGLIVSMGFGEIFQKYLWIKQILKVIGCVYMLYLSWQILSSTTKPNNSNALKPFSFLQAVLFQWINPKAWLMFIGAISVFTLATNSYYNAFAISSLFFLVGLPCVGIWLVFGASLREILKNETYQRYFNIVMAAGLIASIVMIIFD